MLRGELYNFTLDFFGMERETELGCRYMSLSGSRDGDAFWDFDTAFKCTTVNYPTNYTIYNPDDYKRCVC